MPSLPLLPPSSTAKIIKMKSSALQYHRKTATGANQEGAVLPLHHAHARSISVEISTVSIL
jgi:hypothetical protein